MAWATSKSYVVQAGMVVGTLPNFPALFAWTDPDFRSVANGGLVQTGFDFAFFDDSAGSPGAMLDFEKEYHDLVNGTIAYWARVPSMVVGARVHVQLGDATVVASLENKTGVWSNGYVLVDHLVDGVSLTLSDSTTSPATGTKVGTPVAAPGRSWGGMFLDEATTSSIHYGAPTKLDMTTQFTYSIWAKLAKLPADAYAGLISKSRNVNGSYVFNSFYVKSNGKLAAFVCTAGSGTATNYDGGGTNTLTPLIWNYLSMTFNTAFGVRGFLNGVLDGSAAGTAPSTNPAGLNTNVGHDIPFGPRRFPGWLDEPRISNVERSADWERACYFNQYNPKVFWGVPAGLIASVYEQFSNAGASTLSSNIAATATSFTVASGAALSGRGGFRTKIGSEIALVRTLTGNVCSNVIRGAENTLPAAHTAGDAVEQVLTGMSLRSLAIPGRLALQRVPSAGDFTALNASTSTITSDDAGVVISAPAKGSGFNLIGMYQPAPEPPYTVTASFLFMGLHKQYVGFGMHWGDYNGPLAMFDCLAIDGETCELSQRKANSPTAFNAGYLLQRIANWPRWMRITDDGTNRKCWLSPDGQTWMEIHSVARNDFFNPDYVGWQVYNENVATPNFGAILRLLTWDVVTNAY